MRKLLLCCLISAQSLYALPLDLHMESPHIQIHYSENDSKIIPDLLQNLEQFYLKISEELQHTMSQPLQINIHPNIQSHHKKVGLPDAPDWLVAFNNSEFIDIVSPLNPGSYHSENNIRKIMRLSVVKSIFYDKFGKDKFPHWLAFGIGALKAEYSYLCPLKNIPSLKELETADSIEFAKFNGFQAAYCFTKFIQDTYGWDALMNMSSDYSLYSEEFYNDWARSISNNTSNSIIDVSTFVETCF